MGTGVIAFSSHLHDRSSCLIKALRQNASERKSERIRALQYAGEVLTYKNAQTSHLSLNSNGSVLFQQTITHYFVFGGKLPQVSHHWCRFTMGSVNILTSAAQHSGTVQAVSSLPMTPQHHVENTGSQTQLGPLVKNETVIEMVQRTTTVLSSVWFTGMCVCVRSSDVCVTLLSLHQSA